MHQPDTARRNASGKRKPDLNIDTSGPIEPSRVRDGSHGTPESSPGLPPSPPPKALGRALRTTRDALDIETFLEGLTPITPIDPNDMSDKENDRIEAPRPNPRDSHDLSLPARQGTRDSLVTNMLLSLDQLGQSSGPFGSGSRGLFDDPGTHFSQFAHDDSRTMTFNSRAARNGHGYSYSSDLEGADDASRISSRGRRSNSSSGFQSGLGRINSMRETGQTTRALHSRGGKGSKSSSTNSIDAGYAQVIGSQRWARGFGRRSSSFDYGEARAAASSNPPAQSPWHIEFSKSFFNNDEYEAAPTPHVPVGPRRLATVPSLPVLPPLEHKHDPKQVMPERRRSTRSSKSATVGRKSESSKMHNSRDVPPMPVPVPAFDLDSAPAPHVGYEKSKDPAERLVTGVQQPKEKPGFFRRMFGSSKTPSFGTNPSVETPGKQTQQAATAPPSREAISSTAQTLTKKTSSFFRRRKQSITDTEPPPLPILSAGPSGKLALPKTSTLASKPEPSPITSLRRAMDPFLQDSPPNTRDIPLPTTEKSSRPVSPDYASSPEANRKADDGQGRHRGFSPDYDPSPNAVIRKVDPESTADSAYQETPRIETPSRPPPGPLGETPPKSFLQDDSEDEASPRRTRKAPPQGAHGKELKPLEIDTRARSQSPAMSKSKSSPNLGRAKDDARASLRHEANSFPLPGRKDSDTLGLPLASPKADDRSNNTQKPQAGLPSLKIDSAEPSPKESINVSEKSIDEPDLFVVGDPTEDDRQKAQKIFDGNEDFISKDKAAAWMGEEGPVRQRTLRAYMDLYDFENQSIVNSLRQVCHKLLLRAETQQVDRILVAFSKRWCDCNPNHGFKAIDVIHTICYSIMLLNTDLHMADIEHKMTRSQFIKNTMTTIKEALQDSAPEVFDRPSILPGKGQSLGETRPSGDHDRRSSFRASFMPPPRPGSALGGLISEQGNSNVDSCGPLVKAPFDGPVRQWETQVEIVLKEIYASIRDDRLPLYGAEPSPLPTPGGLSVMGMLRRTPSNLSKAPSESVASVRGRIPESAKANSSRWNSKSRSRPRGYGTGFSSSRTSFDDGNSIWSPTDTGSATWSKASLGRTHTSMSMDSFGSSFHRGDFQQSIGFASALSQAIIREDNALDVTTSKDDSYNAEILDDESLELAGPPWVKEGIVTHKHHLDGVDKRAKDRNWTEVFAVIQKGTLSMFSFSPNKSTRNKSRLRAQGNKGGVVGGGNWQDNATNLGTFSLRQTLASALPPPGYSRSRPHVWALSLPSGAVHLFQVGTPEISKEFVSTANYWSARLSTHPLVGGISNIEYGWSDAVINSGMVSAAGESSGNLSGPPGTGVSGGGKGHSRPGSAANAGSISTAMGVVGVGRSSIQSSRSIRSSSFDFGRPGSGSSGVLGSHHIHGMHTGSVSNTLHRAGKLPGDRIHIAEWQPPAASLRPNNTQSERQQLENLENYVRSIEEELQVHNSLRSPMLLAFTPRGSNATKAMSNWERKSEYLLREIVKFRTYVDCLREADLRRREIYAERENARRAARGEELESLDDGDRQVQDEEKAEK